MTDRNQEITILASRRVKPGHEEDYANWLQRVVMAIREYPGYRGVTLITSPGNVRYVIYRFADEATLEAWHNSAERRELIDQVDEYVTHQYESATGLETWFALPNLHAVVPPPKWKMVPVTLLAVFVVTYVARLLLNPLTASWTLAASVLLSSTIIVVSLTYLVMPGLSRLFKKWLYPESERRL